MAEIIKNGYQYIPAILGPTNYQAIVMGDDGSLVFYTLPFSSQISSLKISTTGSLQFLGSSSSPFVISSASNGLSAYTSVTATSGDSRTLYIKQTFNGAGGSGETLRAYTLVNGVSVATGGTVNGAHITLGFTGSGATVAGQAFGLRVNYDVAASVSNLGGASNAVVLLENNIATGPTFHANTAFIRFNELGTQKLQNLFSITNPGTTMFANAGTGAGAAGNAGGSVCAKVLKIIVDGTDYWIGLNNTNAS